MVIYSIASSWTHEHQTVIIIITAPIFSFWSNFTISHCTQSNVKWSEHLVWDRCNAIELSCSSIKLESVNSERNFYLFLFVCVSMSFARLHKSKRRINAGSLLVEIASIRAMCLCSQVFAFQSQHFDDPDGKYDCAKGKFNQFEARRASFCVSLSRRTDTIVNRHFDTALLYCHE